MSHSGAGFSALVLGRLFAVIVAGLLSNLVAADGARPPRAIGVNYFDCFLRTLKDGADTSYDAGFRVLGERAIPFARFCATGHWPVDLALYQQNRADYFRLMDAVVASARRHGVGLIPSLFWSAACVPDLVGEPLDQWGNRDSRTQAFMRTYVQEVVTRYRDDPAIWAWEFGNEYSLGASLPNAAEHRPPCHPTLGTPATRSARDDLTFAIVRAAFSAFADEVRRHDQRHPIVSGDAFPRPSAWHQEHRGAWGADDAQQAATALSDATPTMMSALSVHLYDDDDRRLPAAVATAKRLGKPLFVGEFGVPGTGDTVATHLRRMFQAVVDQDIPWSALWVYDFAGQPEWSVTATNARAWQLDLITEANREFRVAAGRAAVAQTPMQYLVINREHGSPWNVARPDSFTRDSFLEVRNAFPAPANGHVRLALSGIFSYFNAPADGSAASSLRRFLSLAQENDMPVLIALDGENWWEARPDLWNWWDAALPGYDPANRATVEWTSWSSDDAVKLMWRNWGRQVRVRPQPNLMSPRYRAACHAAMTELVPLIVAWWQQLPATRKHLLVGVKVGWESSLGVNAYHYPGGNALLNQPAERDPTTGLLADQPPARGLAQIGFAAVSTAGIRTNGTLTEADLAEVIRRHLDDLAHTAATLGLPRHLVFTHAVGWQSGERAYDAALNPWSTPGWSFYQHASDPLSDAGVRRVLAHSDAPGWAAVEWLHSGADTARAWESSLRRTLSTPGCRHLTIYNWGGIRTRPHALTAIAAVLADDRRTP